MPLHLCSRGTTTPHHGCKITTETLLVALQPTAIQRAATAKALVGVAVVVPRPV